MIAALSSSYKIKDVALPNRFVMAPMARQKSPGGIDFLHASTRRFWLPEFDGSEVNTGTPPNSPDQDWVVLFKGQKMYDDKMGQ